MDSSAWKEREGPSPRETAGALERKGCLKPSRQAGFDDSHAAVISRTQNSTETHKKKFFNPSTAPLVDYFHILRSGSNAGISRACLVGAVGQTR